ncbi:dihydroneopterin triphosphate diphosphatase [Chitinibacter bivalviorum]|uniref:Dihydroneopterin triphosphate diphosphatase n=1 Tax=Chitinibacter bivalviorum TaxID=2739434 RepID=A0A7H9BI16_9NEIS|nr:dihydroneopterin triphosphate diphosphatase [Chitinibacter bivalviorum]QLG87848.1 dihydroneopterin triphosphate diphosphatase [Chitinibacter bivalviorum]
MPYKQPVSILLIIHTPELDVLLLERNDFTDAWQSVTGSREGDESLINTAQRELAEETGLRVDVSQIRDWESCHDFEIFEVWRHRYAPGVTMNTEHVFSVEIPVACEVDISPNEHRRFKWVNWQQAAEMVFSPSNAEALRELPARMGH